MFSSKDDPTSAMNSTKLPSQSYLDNVTGKVCEFIVGVMNKNQGYVTIDERKKHASLLCRIIPALGDNCLDYQSLLFALTYFHASQLDNNPDPDYTKLFRTHLSKLFESIKRSDKITKEDDRFYALVLLQIHCLIDNGTRKYAVSRMPDLMNPLQECLDMLERLTEITSSRDYKIYSMTQWLRLSLIYNIRLSRTIKPEDSKNRTPVLKFAKLKEYEILHNELKTASRVSPENSCLERCFKYLLDVQHARATVLRENRKKNKLTQRLNNALPDLSQAVSVTSMIQEELVAIFNNDFFEFLRFINQKSDVSPASDNTGAPDLAGNKQKTNQSFHMINQLGNLFNLPSFLLADASDLLDRTFFLYSLIHETINDIDIYKLSVQDKNWLLIKKLKENQCWILKQLVRYDALNPEYNVEDYTTELAKLTEELDYMEKALERYNQFKDIITKQLEAEQVRRPPRPAKKVSAPASPMIRPESRNKNKSRPQVKSEDHQPDSPSLQMENKDDIYERIKSREFIEAEQVGLRNLDQANTANDHARIAYAYSDLGDIYRLWSLALIDEDLRQKQELARQCYQLCDTAVNTAVAMKSVHIDSLTSLQAFNREYWVPPAQATKENIESNLLTPPGTPNLPPPPAIQPDPSLQSMYQEIDLPMRVIAIAKKLHDKGHRVLVVGGAVRAKLLGEPATDDFDLVTDASVETVTELFHGEGELRGNNYPVFNIPGDKPVQISWISSRYQTAGTRLVRIKDGNTHVLNPTENLYEDAIRRDFTANAFYYDIFAKQIFYLNGALAHLQRRQLVFINPTVKTIQDDPIKILRAIRYQAKTNLDISPEDIANLRAHIHLLHTSLAPARFRFEMDKTLNVLNKERLYKCMDEIGLLSEMDRKKNECSDSKTTTPGYLLAALKYPGFLHREESPPTLPKSSIAVTRRH